MFLLRRRRRRRRHRRRRQHHRCRRHHHHHHHHRNPLLQHLSMKQHRRTVSLLNFPRLLYHVSTIWHQSQREGSNFDRQSIHHQHRFLVDKRLYHHHQGRHLLLHHFLFLPHQFR